MQTPLLRHSPQEVVFRHLHLPSYQYNLLPQALQRRLICRTCNTLVFRLLMHQLLLQDHPRLFTTSTLQIMHRHTSLAGEMPSSEQRHYVPIGLLVKSNQIVFFAPCAKSGFSFARTARTVRTPGYNIAENVWLGSELVTQIFILIY